MSNPEKSTLRRIVDALHSSPLARIIPVLTALLVYGLYIAFGADEQKLVLTIAAPVMSAVWYFACGLIVRMAQNPRYAGQVPPDAVILALTAVFSLAAIALLIQFLTDLQTGFTMALPLATVT